MFSSDLRHNVTLQNGNPIIGKNTAKMIHRLLNLNHQEKQSNKILYYYINNGKINK